MDLFYQQITVAHLHRFIMHVLQASSLHHFDTYIDQYLQSFYILLLCLHQLVADVVKFVTWLSQRQEQGNCTTGPLRRKRPATI